MTNSQAISKKKTETLSKNNIDETSRQDQSKKSIKNNEDANSDTNAEDEPNPNFQLVEESDEEPPKPNVYGLYEGKLELFKDMQSKFSE